MILTRAPRTSAQKSEMSVHRVKNAIKICQIQNLISVPASSSSGTCGRYWDGFLCWPVSESNATVAIPCNANDEFVQLVISAKPEIRTENIPGKYKYFKYYVASKYVVPWSHMLSMRYQVCIKS
jgi:hypothetical protein